MIRGPFVNSGYLAPEYARTHIFVPDMGSLFQLSYKSTYPGVHSSGKTYPVLEFKDTRYDEQG